MFHNLLQPQTSLSRTGGGQGIFLWPPPSQVLFKNVLPPLQSYAGEPPALFWHHYSFAVQVLWERLSSREIGWQYH